MSKRNVEVREIENGFIVEVYGNGDRKETYFKNEKAAAKFLVLQLSTKDNTNWNGEDPPF